METKTLSVFGSDDPSLPMPVRLREAAARAALTVGRIGQDSSPYVLRPDQENVFRDLTMYLADAAERPAAKDDVPLMGRIIIPSRIGKTVVAGKFIASSGLLSTFIVPTKILLDQAVSSFAVLLDSADNVGYFYSEGQRLVEHGVNVITYQSINNLWKLDGCLPDQIAKSGLVFADEGHVSMTRQRLEIMRKAFAPGALRIAMTATPDYGDERELGRYYPVLIHELPLAEAMDMELLAPLRVWVAEVDVDASQVRIIAGNYDEGQLGSLMSAAPFFKAALQFRYNHLDNPRRGALMCCGNRQQAWDLWRYLIKFRPAGSPKPVVVDKDTPRPRRAAIVKAFEAGRIDTIINVRTMLTGWDSARCKVLVDLFPSTSHVLAMQKYFRPLTRDGAEEARIYLLIPANLPKVPVLPTDFFLFGKGEYETGSLIASPKEITGGGEHSPKDRHPSPIAGVALKSRIVLTQRFERPKLDPGNWEQVKAVCLSDQAVRPERIPGYQRFRWLYFNHDLFKGHGWQLLRYLGVSSNKQNYLNFMAKMFAEAASDQWWKIAGMTVAERRMLMEPSCYDDVDLLIQYVASLDWRQINKKLANLRETARACFGSDRVPSPEDGINIEDLSRELKIAMLDLKPFEQTILKARYPFDETEPKTIRELADEFKRSRARIRDIEIYALRMLRQAIYWPHLKPFL
jgi:superfamily II DNA or RNA helicase